MIILLTQIFKRTVQLTSILLIVLLTLSTGCKQKVKNKPIIIAHRGASGYLPEHTLESKAMAYAMGPDFLEQDVVLTKDDRPVVIHDHFLDTVSNVADLYPDKKRRDGRYYVIDFTLKELKKLNMHERIDLKTGRAVYPGRFPVAAITHFEISTLEEEIELIQGLNKSTGKNIGIYTELKSPWFHKKEGKHIEKITLNVLKKYGYTTRDSNCYIQCFDPNSLLYMKNVLKTKLRLVQLIADNSWNETPGVDYNQMMTPEGLDKVAKYADAIGPWLNQVITDNGKGNKPTYTALVELAHERGLLVHPYTIRADELPSYVTSINKLFELFFMKMKIDGVFSDFPDKAVHYLQENGLR